MTESVIEALRGEETDGAPVGAAISRPLQDAARSHDDAAGETDCHGPQAALAMTQRGQCGKRRRRRDQTPGS